MKRLLGRRTLLRGAGAAALSLPLLEAMIPTRRSRAQPSAPPRRVVLVLTPNGFHVDRWKCAIEGDAARDFELSPILAELAPLREHALFLEGVPMSSAVDARTCAAGHPGGTAAVFTGAWAGPGGNYGGTRGCRAGFPEHPSVDHLLARNFGGVTRFPAVRLGAHTLDNTLARRCFFGEGQTAHDVQDDPYRAVAALFSDPAAPDGAAELERQLRRRRRVLDLVADEVRRVRCELGGEDRVRLDAHLTQVEGLEARLGLTGDGGADCHPPEVGAGLDARRFGDLPELVQAQIDIAAMALRCDLTRVVGLQIHAPDSHGEGVYGFLGHDRSWHDVTHRRGDDYANRIEGANRWYARQVASLAERLAATPEADGSTMLDHTVILWGSEVGRGWTHDKRDVVWTLLGGGAHFDTGRYLRFSGEERHRHNGLLAHLLHFAGVEGTVGPADYAAEPLPGLLR